MVHLFASWTHGRLANSLRRTVSETIRLYCSKSRSTISVVVADACESGRKRSSTSARANECVDSLRLPQRQPRSFRAPQADCVMRESESWIRG